MAAVAALVSALSWGRWVLLGVIAPDLARFGPAVAWPAAGLLALATALGFVAHRALVRDPPPLRTQLAGALAVGALAAAMLPFLSNDVFSVLAYTDLAWNSTVNPLTLGPPGLRASRFFHLVSPAWNWTPCVYGPLQLAFWAPALAGQAMAAVLIAKGLAFLAHAALLVLLYLRARDMPGAQRGSAFALAAFAPVLWVEGVGQAHADLPTAVFIAAWLLFATRGHVVLAGLALGLAVASKLTALVVVGMYLVHLLVRGGPTWSARLGRTALAFVSFLAAAGLCYAFVWHGVWTFKVPLKALGYRSPTHTFFEVAYQVLETQGYRLRQVRPAMNAITAGLTACVAVVGIYAAVRSRTLPDLAARACGILVLSLTLAGSVYHSWYLVACVPLALELRDPSWRRWFLVSSSAVVVLGGSCLFDWGGLHHDLYRVPTVTLACVLSVWLLPSRFRAVAGTSLALPEVDENTGGDMAKPLTKPSDRGRDNPEPGDTPGTRSSQRGTVAQLEREEPGGDPAVEWERSEQDKLPPRGAGSQRNQGDDKEPTVAEVGEDAVAGPDIPAATSDAGLQLGGDKGPSNQGR
jgi:hypothetical protein